MVQIIFYFKLFIIIFDRNNLFFINEQCTLSYFKIYNDKMQQQQFCECKRNFIFKNFYLISKYDFNNPLFYCFLSKKFNYNYEAFQNWGICNFQLWNFYFLYFY
ncbi:hypothetical protein IMG5_198750 [Ichthyophthirius multifiliis]|uniref:Uncharacterized protein n=1 Tax=Ichthyophthirius multifiliis TaxID=5932 RepID=G0R5G1_ICHMU|nr:hypothetical protein IMG5_198750 [Ichthyophthirius multifiliis]EGR27283.1 hypothetical protein IMG5_198750 [Ichthyophthirius multifiliis]|eukprot:XP_004024167.1 hypothetical protein IMG5_198750 [Ichthyophthirius multifiliis]